MEVQCIYYNFFRKKYRKVLLERLYLNRYGQRTDFVGRTEEQWVSFSVWGVLTCITGGRVGRRGWRWERGCGMEGLGWTPSGSVRPQKGRDSEVSPSRKTEASEETRISSMKFWIDFIVPKDLRRPLCSVTRGPTKSWTRLETEVRMIP